MAWRPQIGRLNHLLNDGKVKVTNRGVVRGVSILIDDFIITKTEAPNAAILKLNFDLKDYHNTNYRSDEAFRSGSVRNFGLQLSPAFRPSTKVDRLAVSEHLCYQGISVLSDRFKLEFGSDPNSIPKIRALSYYWGDEKDRPTMVCPTALIEQVSSDHLKAYEKMDFDLKSNVPKFISEFHIDAFAECLNQARLEAWIAEQLVELD